VPATHNGAVPLRLVVRVVLLAACAAGCVVCVLTYRSQDQLRRAFDPAAVAKRPFGVTLRALRDSDSAFNPSAFRETGIAISLLRLGRGAESERVLSGALRREPHNVNLWTTLAQIQVARHRLAAARSTYARARALDPHLPDRPPPPI
jgi:Flp pilus assembly protein TadD